MSWIYNDREFTPDMIPQEAVGFIYEMRVVIDGVPRGYIGKKDFYANIKKPMGKKELALVTDKRLKTYTRVKKLSYQNYYSSNDVLKQAKKDGVDITRRILKICYSKAELTYSECKYLFCMAVLEQEFYLNGNILGKFYKQV